MKKSSLPLTVVAFLLLTAVRAFSQGEYLHIGQSGLAVGAGATFLKDVTAANYAFALCFKGILDVGANVSLLNRYAVRSQTVGNAYVSWHMMKQDNPVEKFDAALIGLVRLGGTGDQRLGIGFDVARDLLYGKSTLLIQPSAGVAWYFAPFSNVDPVNSVAAGAIHFSLSVGVKSVIGKAIVISPTLIFTNTPLQTAISAAIVL